MKGAILTADAITTVSRAYSDEILTADQGCGLEGVLQTRKSALHGILNGLDYSVWDPAEDRHLVKNYSASASAGKLASKLTLQNELGLEQSQTVPLLAMVTRLASQKGIDLLLEIAPHLTEGNLQLVILGSGDEYYLKRLKELQETMPRSLSVIFGFNAKLAHRIYAGSDIFLMPSRYEPCGLGQMIALRYGSVPVVRKTGGLADTVVDRRDGARDPNGFTFDEYTAEDFLAAVKRAVAEFRESRTEWRKLVRRGMSADLSWHKSAEQYEALYRAELAKKG
jgi:starch synthase